MTSAVSPRCAIFSRIPTVDSTSPRWVHGDSRSSSCTNHARNCLTVNRRVPTVKQLHESRAPYLQADVEFLDDDTGEIDQAVLNAVSRRFAQYRQVVRTEDGDSPIPGDPSALSWAVASAMVLDLDEKQRLLACATAAERLSQERDLLVRETALLEELPSLPVFDARQFTISRN